jgi:tetratricopeptide (TPR) repeat protein
VEIGLSVEWTLTRLEKLLAGSGEAREGDPLFVREVLRDPDLPQSRVDGLFLTHKRVGESLLMGVREAYPNDLNSIVLLTRIYASGGKYSEAEAEFKNAMGQHPGNAWLTQCYASFLRELGRREEADRYYQRALGLDPQEPNYRIEYAMFLEEIGRAGRAKKFIKQALKLLSPRDERKDWLTVWQKGFLGRTLWRLLSDPPTAGSLSRLARHHGEELVQMYEEEPRAESIYMRRVRETGLYGEAVLKVEEAKSRMAVEDPDEWAHIEEMDILNSWKPGFGLYVNQLFYGCRCPGCGLEGRKLMGCSEGLYNCAFEEEYDQFEMDTVREVVEMLKEGEDPVEITQLHVPEPLKEIAQRLQPRRDSPE